jgi:hypothetical protein
MISVLNPVLQTRTRVFVEEDSIKQMLGVHIHTHAPLSEAVIYQLKEIEILTGLTCNGGEYTGFILARDHRNIELIMTQIMLALVQNGYKQATKIEGYSTQDLFTNLQYQRVPTTIDTVLAVVEFDNP